MSENTTNNGVPAVVLLRDGKVYEGVVQVTGPFVHITSARRRIGRDGNASYSAASDYTWPHARIEHVRWLKAAS